MSTVRDVIRTALDEADNKFQHGVGPDPNDYIDLLTDAVLLALREAGQVETWGAVERLILPWEPARWGK